MNSWLQRLDLLLQSFSEEMQRSQRLYRMSWVVGMLVCGYVFLSIFDASALQVERLENLYQQGERTASVGSIQLWQSRSAQQEELQEELRNFCWLANNPQLASADIQTTLQRIINRYAIVNSRLTVASPEIWDNSLWRIRAQLTGKLDSGSHYLALLNDLEDLKRFIAVERVSLTSTGRGETIDMLVSVCFTRKVE